MRPPADPHGARGSNAGDQLHELWALEQALALLEPSTTLKALTVEGVEAQDPDQATGTRQWDGVDCALYFGGETLESAESVDLVQLKYSTDPGQTWSIARLTRNTAKKSNNSALCRLAEAYRAAREKRGSRDEIRVRFISNQPIAEDANLLVRSIATGDPVPDNARGDLQRIESATGLNSGDLAHFLASLDVSECGSSSRFAVRERVLLGIAHLIEDNAASTEADLRQRIREVMLPERTGEIITQRTVLSWFGISERDGLFPCPPAIKPAENPVIRDAARRVVAQLKNGERLVCLHGPGGCGKTTVVQEIQGLLPSGSHLVVFDCYGAGRYRHSDDKRHLPENALLQIANDLASTLRTPLFLPRDGRNPVNLRQLLRRVKQTADALASESEAALLVLAVDAADNSVAVARARGEPCFVDDLCGADLVALPPNVRILLSTRTARLEDLRLPRSAVTVECPEFTVEETGAFVRRVWPDSPDSWIDQFHKLSNGVPRVQDYAIANAHKSQSQVLDWLRPGGKGLRDVLNQQFKEAVQKTDQAQCFDDLVSGLAVLPTPIPPRHLAAIAHTTTATVMDSVRDLSPGLQIDPAGIAVADEDFEDFLRQEVRKDDEGRRLSETRAAVANELLASHASDAYAATHVAEALVEAGQGGELLLLIESEPTAVADLVARREVQLRRLRLALAVCGRAGDGRAPDCLRVVLLAADAERDEATLHDLVAKETDLAVAFAWPTLRRLVLADRDSATRQGSVLAHDSARAVRCGDRFLARERLAAYGAWLQRRNAVGKEDLGNWPVNDDDLAARAEALFELSGAKAVIDDLVRWRPRDVPVRVALQLVPMLLSRGRGDAVLGILKDQIVPEPWTLLLAIPLARAGYQVDRETIAGGLKQVVPLVRCLRGIDAFASRSNWQAELLQLLLTACELGVALGVKADIVLRTLRQLRVGDRPRLAASQVLALDAELRCWLLEQHLAGAKAAPDAFLDWLFPQSRADVSDGKGTRKLPLKDQHAELWAVIKALFPVYSGRLAIICGDTPPSRDALAAMAPATDGHSSYRFEDSHWSNHLRAQAAISIMQLAAMPESAPRALLEQGLRVIEGRYADTLGGRAVPLLKQLLVRSSEHGLIHQAVIDKANALKSAVLPSSDKVDSLVTFSRLLLRIHEGDAKELFLAAVDTARQVDREVHDQIDLLGAWDTAIAALDEDQRRTIAADIDSFVSAAARRVASYYDGFPWPAAARCLARLSIPVGLSSIARWADDGTAEFGSTLQPLLAAAVADGSLGPADAAALAILLEEPDLELTKQILAAAKDAPIGAIREELARDCLLHVSPGRRLEFGRAIAALAPQAVPPDQQARLLDRTVRFLEAQEERTRARCPGSPLAGGPSDSHVDPDTPAFNDSELTDANAMAAALKALREPRSAPRLRALLAMMRRQVPLSLRVRFLNALASVELERWDHKDLADAIVECVRTWRESPAVDRWRLETLPGVISKRLAYFAAWLKEGESSLPALLETACPDPGNRLAVITKGVEASRLALGGRTLYGVAELMVKSMSPSDSARALQWYIQRLTARIPVQERKPTPLADIPSSAEEATGRFIYALLSDIDARVRWRAAHALRRLARMGGTEVLDAVLGCWPRQQDAAYRSPEAPYYWLAARLWLMMTLNRIAHETPELLTKHLRFIAAIAVSVDLPHLLMREHAKRAALHLLEATGPTDDVDVNALLRVNTSPFAGRRRAAEHDDGDDSVYVAKSADGFEFETMDTTPYWYGPLRRLFPGTSMRDVLDRASHWIIDKWGAPRDANYWDKEPRHERYDERRWGLYSHRHGGLPVIERYGTHLEWHAMLCVAGELMRTQPLVAAEDDYRSFEAWMARLMPTGSDHWIADLRQGVPLESRFWLPDQGEDETWLNSAGDHDFLSELGLSAEAAPSRITVDAYHETHFPTRVQKVSVSSALVSPPTAAALVRALQTTPDPHDFRIPPEDDDLQIREGPYLLEGWLATSDREMAFDSGDPLRNDCRAPQSVPGRRATTVLGLQSAAGPRVEWMTGGLAALTGELWSDWATEQDDGRQSGKAGSSGWRLWIDKDALQRFLTRRKADLIFEVLITRRLHKDNRESYDPDPKKNKTSHRILLCTRDGRICGATEDFGSWQTPGDGTAT